MNHLRTDQTTLRVMRGRIGVLSDLHLAPPGRALGFQGTSWRWLPFLDGLLQRCDAVVVNGDLFDLERGVVPFLFDHELRAAWQTHDALLARLQAAHVRWTAGNHDRALLRSGHAVPFLNLEVPQGTIRIEHGDRFNAPIKQVRPLTTTATWASGRMVAVGADRLYRTLRQVERVLTRERVDYGTGSDERLGPIERSGARWLAKQPDFVGMVLGHTHRAGIWRTAGGWLANPGGCTHDQPGWLEIDVDAGQLTCWQQDLTQPDAPRCHRTLPVLERPQPG